MLPVVFDKNYFIKLCLKNINVSEKIKFIKQKTLKRYITYNTNCFLFIYVNNIRSEKINIFIN